MAEVKKKLGRPKKNKVVEQIKTVVKPTVKPVEKKVTKIPEVEDLEDYDDEIDITNDISAEEFEKLEQEESVFKLSSKVPQVTQSNPVEIESLESALKGKIEEKPKEFSKEEKDQIQREQDLDKYSKSIAMKGELKYYGVSDPVVEQETEESLRVQTINILMSEHGFHYIEAKAQIEIMQKEMDLLKIREIVTKGQFVKYSTEVKEASKVTQVGVQVQSQQHNVKYY